MARGLLKALVVGTPETALFAFTGSSMCAVWVNVAATAPNGISMLVHNARCHLPAAVSASAAAESWQFLQQARPGLPADLANYISHSLPAMQVFLSQELLAQLVRPSSEAELLAFVQEFEVNKLQMEVRSCKSGGLAGRPVFRLVLRREATMVLHQGFKQQVRDYAGLQGLPPHLGEPVSKPALGPPKPGQR